MICSLGAQDHHHLRACRCNFSVELIGGASTTEFAVAAELDVSVGRAKLLSLTIGRR